MRSLHLFTAGFAETGDPELVAQEDALIKKLTDNGIRAIGPNCMGLYVPEEQVAFMSGFPSEPGNVFLISQSGANAGDIVNGLARRGVRFSKGVSFGNGADVKAHHLLDYAVADPQTEVIVAYMEGVQEGRQFFQALKRAARVKPTVILKGGIHEAGARAANSHTGSLAGSVEIFEAATRQTGAIRAETMDDLQDIVVALTTSAKNVHGTGVVLVSGGGGYAVLASDAIATAGLDVPQMPQSTIDSLREFIPVAGHEREQPDRHQRPKRRGPAPHARDCRSCRADRCRVHQRQRPRRPRPRGIRTASTGTHREGPRRRRESPRASSPSSRRRPGRRSSRSAEAGVPATSRSRAEDAYGLEAYKHGLGMFANVARAARAVGLIQQWRKRRAGLPEIF